MKRCITLPGNRVTVCQVFESKVYHLMKLAHTCHEVVSLITVATALSGGGLNGLSSSSFRLCHSSSDSASKYESSASRDLEKSVSVIVTCPGTDVRPLILRHFISLTLKLATNPNLNSSHNPTLETPNY